MKEIPETANDSFQSVNQGLNTLRSGMDQFFLSLSNRSITAKDRWDAVWNAMLQTALRVFSEIIFKALVAKKAVDAVGGGDDGGGGGGGFFSTVGRFLDRLIGFGDGGEATRPQLALVGEKGPEIIAPREDFKAVVKGLLGVNLFNPQVTQGLSSGGGGGDTYIIKVSALDGADVQRVMTMRGGIVDQMKILKSRGERI